MNEFNPTGFNVDEWILEAKNAGMKYFLITTKHHDGFALWPTKVERYKVFDSTPFGTDILVDNCSRSGNFQLNTGPKANGNFPAASIRRLRERGAWLTVNGGKEIYLCLDDAKNLNEINVGGLLVAPKETTVLEIKT